MNFRANKDTNTQWQSKYLQKNVRRKSASASNHHKRLPPPNSSSKTTAKQRAFSSFFTRLHIGRFKAAPYKSSKWSLAKVSVSSVSRIDIGTFFRFMMKQQLKKRKIYKKNGHSRNNKYSKSFSFSYGSSSDLLSTEPH